MAPDEAKANKVLYLLVQRLYRSRKFLDAYVFPYLDLHDLAKYIQVCRSWTRVAYNQDVVAACVRNGGLTHELRGRFWVMMVGMSLTPPSTHGLLGLLAAFPLDRPEEHYKDSGRQPLPEPLPAMGAKKATIYKKYSGKDWPSAMARKSSLAWSMWTGPSGNGNIGNGAAGWEGVDIVESGAALHEPRGWFSQIYRQTSTTSTTSATSPGRENTPASPPDPSLGGSNHGAARNSPSTPVRGRSHNTQPGPVGPSLRSLLGLGKGPWTAASSATGSTSPEEHASDVTCPRCHNSLDNPVNGATCRCALERVPGLYHALLHSAEAIDSDDMKGVKGSKRSMLIDIDKDVHRTLRMANVEALRNVLQCVSLFIPGVGYVQGMNCLCRFLLQNLGDREEEVFWVFSGMLQQFGMRSMYTPGMPLLRLRFFQLDRLLLWHLPSLYEHLEGHSITADLYATSWFITLLADGNLLPDSELKLVWDQMFMHHGSQAEQWAVVFRIILELLRRAQPRLLSMERFDEVVQAITDMPFRDLCGRDGARGLLSAAAANFEGSIPLTSQLCMLHDDWTARGDLHPLFKPDVDA